MNNKLLLSLFLAAAPAAMVAQQQKTGYVDWGIKGTDFPAAFAKWEKGQKWSTDDNFFISRVKPKTRFRNTATQVNPLLTEDVDKKLIYWVPVNNEYFNALPDGQFDSDVFPMWSYVTHYGNWSTTLMRMPGNFADAAHRNGVPVSVVASVPWGNISEKWQTALQKLVDVGAEKMADFMTYYGIDGIGYNSEFATRTSIPMDLAAYHADIRHRLVDTGRNPITEFIWYDGTNEQGNITFDNGLGTHNDDLWGYGDDIKTALFFNYNWNKKSLLNKSVMRAEDVGRTPLDLYVGINMQGREPKSGDIWPLLKDYPLSIGLWGAHSENMIYESRAERGSSADVHMRTFMLRLERWFTGGSRNPANTPDFSNSLKYSSEHTDFMGMSKMMSARSSLKWDLSEEPFISYFNLGNGKFFNFKGERCHDSEWYNIGMQDYMPTWMWWFSSRFLSGNAADVPADGLDAEFVWDDAWMGGSLVKVAGSSSDEYLHLFKTEFPLQAGDEITVRYKVLAGNADIALALSAKGSEQTVADEAGLSVLKSSDALVPGNWIEKKFIVGQDAPALSNKELAMVALHFRNASGLDMRLGEFSIVRPGATSARPAQPQIESGALLSSRHGAADGKIIFNMPNDKPVGEVCYNTDVNTSLFKLYACQEGEEPVLMGMTSSWAGMLFNIPVNPKGSNKIIFGVSALSLDMTAESEIAWGEWYDLDAAYQITDDVNVNKTVFKPGEAIEIAYNDARHPASTWILSDDEGNEVARSENSLSLSIPDGIEKLGNYTLRIDGLVHNEDGTTASDKRTWPAIVQVSHSDKGAVPQISSFTVNGSSDAVELTSAGDVDVEYTTLPGNAKLSRGLKVGKYGVGLRYRDTETTGNKSFSVSFWFKPDDYKGKSLQLFSVRDKQDKWSNNNWGWFWHILNEDGTTSEFAIRMNNNSVKFDLENCYITPGVWHHFAYVFDVNSDKQVRPSFYLDGKKVDFKSFTRNDQTYKIDDEVPYFGTLYDWRENNVVAIGGYTHKIGSVRGNVDNFAFFNNALSDEEVKATMGDFDSNVPASLVGYFDFEQNANSDLSFFSSGNDKIQFRGGNIDYVDDEIEGSGTLKWVEPQYCAGSPFLGGNAHDLNTNVEIEAPGALVGATEGNAEAGKTKVTFAESGSADRFVKLKVSNEYGSDVRVIPVKIGEGKVETVNEESSVDVYPNPFTDRLVIEAPEAGNFRVVLAGLDGALLTANDFKAQSGDKMIIYPEVNKGFYLLMLYKDGKLVSSNKVIRK